VTRTVVADAPTATIAAMHDVPPQDPPRVVTGRLARMGDDERAFDDALWRSVPPHRRVELLWDMVLDALAVNGIHEVPRLQRSVGCLRRP
jgi:hypothetical protein